MIGVLSMLAAFQIPADRHRHMAQDGTYVLPPTLPAIAAWQDRSPKGEGRCW